MSSLDDVAAGAVRLANRHDVCGLDLQGRSLSEIGYDDWADDLDEVLAR